LISLSSDYQISSIFFYFFLLLTFIELIDKLTFYQFQPLKFATHTTIADQQKQYRSGKCFSDSRTGD